MTMSTIEMASNCTCQTAHLAEPLGSLQSPMAELLSTFAPPSPAESAIVVEKILQIAADMAELDSEIGRVEQILERLRHNRTALQKHSDGHQNVLNVTRRLPVEILGEIFIQLQDMLGGRSITPTRVCRHWREVAMSTSRLWRRLIIQYRSELAVEEMEMVSIWLQRSGGQPLNIVLGRIRAEFVEYERENPALDALLHNQAHRWKDVRLIITQSMGSFLRNIPETLPMLQALHISTFAQDGLSSLDNFQNAPALRVLIMDKRVAHYNTSPLFHPMFPWAQLTKCTLLRGGSYTPQDGCRILNEAVNLQNFAMEVNATTRFSPPPPADGMHLVNLLSLDLYVVSGVQTLDLLNLLTLPALTELNFIDTESKHSVSVDVVIDHVEALITRSACSLRRLSLGSCSDIFTRNRLLKLFKLMPMLSELEIRFGSSRAVDASMVDLLTHKSYHGVGLCCLLPRLASIKLAVHSNFSYEKFAALLSSRNNATTCDVGGNGLVQLREAALITWHDVSASGRHAHHLPLETFEEFTELRDSGLDLYVIDGGSSLALEDYFSPGKVDDDSQSEDEDADSEDTRDWANIGRDPYGTW